MKNNEEKFLKILGFLIKRYRGAAKYSQKKLAEDSMISANQLRKIEKAQCNTSVETIFRICNSLGIGIEDLFSEIAELMRKDIIYID